MLLDPLEEQFHSPTRAVQVRDRLGSELEIVRQQGDPLAGFDVYDPEAAKCLRIALRRQWPGERDGLVADQPGRSIDGDSGA